MLAIKAPTKIIIGTIGSTTTNICINRAITHININMANVILFMM